MLMIGLIAAILIGGLLYDGVIIAAVLLNAMIPVLLILAVCDYITKPEGTQPAKTIAAPASWVRIESNSAESRS